MADCAVLATAWLSTPADPNAWNPAYDIFDPNDSSDPNDSTIDILDFAVMASQWMTQGDSFVTTWDTSLGTGTTVTLALAGTVDATIYWGDDTVTDVDTPGPHVHDYGVDGTYTVSVTGSVTEYNSYNNGGVTSEREKLISVDSWGQLGLVSMHSAFHNCSNLVSVPGTSDGIEAVTDMRYMFFSASSFNQDLSGWCVELIPSEPGPFDDFATSWILPRPIWGTCP
jgi:hypothetical protein